MTPRRRAARHRRLSVRIAAGIAAMLLPFSIAVAAGFFAVRSVSGSCERNATKAISDVVPIGNARVALGPFQYAGYEALLGVQAPATFEAPAAAMQRQVDGLVHGAEISREHQALVVAHSLLLREIKHFKALIQAHAAPAPALVSSLQTETTRIDNQLRSAESVAADAVHEAARNADRIQRRTTWEYTAVALFALLAAGAVATYLIRSFARPLRRLQQGVRRITDGDLESRIDLRRRDELGELGDALDHMAAQLLHAKQDLSHQALHDALTGLPNRTLLHDRVTQATNRVHRHQGVVALLFIDLDDFKVVNDTMGHAAGDALLQVTATRIAAELRETDTASRTGGDEFAVLLEDLHDEAEAMAVAERIRIAIGAIYDINGTELRGHASIGVAITRDGDETVSELLRNADIAMYAAKRAGKDRCQQFVDAMHADALERATLERALREAVHGDELTLHYQPEIDLDTGRVAGAEALIRWHHAELGMLPPARFIPLAEETGLIVPLGQWVLRRACAQLVEWQRLDPARYADFKMSVNLSALQLDRPGIVNDVRTALEETGLSPTHLVLELTESMLAGDEELLVRLHELRSLGVGLAVDDFGTGYSSLAYLRRFPLDILKIDRAFVAGIASRHTDATLASTIIELGRMLGLTTVAEGIEEEDQLELLRQLGCSMGQGFLFAKPLPPDDMAQLVAETPVFELPELPDIPSLPGAGSPESLTEAPSGLVPALLQHATDGLALFDADGTLLYVSAASHRLGYRPEEMIGWNALDLVHPDDLPGVTEALITTVATPGQKRPLALRLRGADGDWIPVELVSNNMLDEPSVRGVVVVIRDMRLQGITAAENAPPAIAADEAA